VGTRVALADYLSHEPYGRDSLLHGRQAIIALEVLHTAQFPYSSLSNDHKVHASFSSSSMHRSTEMTVLRIERGSTLRGRVGPGDSRAFGSDNVCYQDGPERNSHVFGCAHHDVDACL
jgi:hypothetical protein